MKTEERIAGQFSRPVSVFIRILGRCAVLLVRRPMMRESVHEQKKHLSRLTRDHKWSDRSQQEEGCFETMPRCKAAKWRQIRTKILWE